MAAPIFRTMPVPMSQPARYQLSIRAPGSQHDFATYTFPITPGALRTEPNAMSSYSDVHGPVSAQGVTRVVDRFGVAPPIFTIEGTTGWDRHLADGFVLTGLQSVQLLGQFISRYETLNQQQLAAGLSKLYSLEFYDYFAQQFWQIEPVGPQIYRQSADRPLLVYYRFRWVAVAPAGFPILGTIDAIANTLLTPAQQAVLNAAQALSGVAAAYGATGVSI